ncbi:MAG: LysR family transcriptional regulator [Gammaproteobacteria bacterium]
MILSTNIRMFLLAARHLSFTVAAREAFVSQPAVTVRIKKLEEHLGVELFTRMPSGLRLTPAGAVFYEYVQKLEILASEAHRAAKDIAEGDEAHLYLGANRSATSYMLPKLLLNFRKAHERVRIRTEVESSDKLLDRLFAGYLDAVIVEQSVDEERFQVTPLLKDEVVVICPPDHELAKKSVCSLEDLRRFPLVTHEPDSGTRQLLGDRLSMEDLSENDLNIVMELQSSKLVKEMVAEGLGIGLVSRLSMSDPHRPKNLEIRSLEGEPLCRFFSLVTTEKGASRSKVQDLIELAKQTYQEDMLFP